jgi:NTE family protein
LNFPTSFDLSAEQVDRLREVAGRVLFNSPDFHRLVRDLGGKLPELAGAPIAPSQVLPASVP